MGKHHDKPDSDISTSSSSTYVPNNSNVPTSTGGAVIISLVVILAVCLCLCLQLRQLRNCLGRHGLLPSYLSAPAYRNKDDLVETGLYEKYCHRDMNNSNNNSTTSSIRSHTSCLVVIKPLPALPN
ncbi:unnamed protein product [Absidia cylindrospora]